VALHEDGDLAVAGDDRFAAAPGGGPDDLPGRPRRRHDEAPRQGLARLRVPDAAVVHLADLALDEARADERDRDTVRAATTGVERVYHLAAQSNVLGAVSDVDYSFTSNVVGTYNVLVAAREAAVGRVVFTSSREVYGEVDRVPVAEDRPMNPKNAYGASKDQRAGLVEAIVECHRWCYNVVAAAVAQGHPTFGSQWMNGGRERTQRTHRRLLESLPEMRIALGLVDADGDRARATQPELSIRGPQLARTGIDGERQATGSNRIQRSTPTHLHGT